MLIEETSQALRVLGERLFGLVEELSVERPMPSHGWYRAEVAGGPALYFRFVGPGARSYPKNSIHLATEWSNALASIDGVTRGNNWYGQTSADLSARADYPQEMEKAEEFVRRAFAGRGISVPASQNAQLHGEAALLSSGGALGSSMTSFPFEDREAILSLADLYWNESSATEAAKERRFEQDFLHARELGYLSKDLFLCVARWKSKRPTPYYKRNSESRIRDVTTKAMAARDDTAALSALMRLSGVRLRTASAILHWLRPDRFPILDVNVVVALGEPEPKSYDDFGLYSRIAQRIRALAGQHQLDLRTIDRALWTWGDKRRRRRQA